jgi:hypothetical protein
MGLTPEGGTGNNGVSGLTCIGGRKGRLRTETLVAVTPSENANDNAAAAAAIEVPLGREVDELVARELVRQARDAGVALTAASIGSHRAV